MACDFLSDRSIFLDAATSFNGIIRSSIIAFRAMAFGDAHQEMINHLFGRFRALREDMGWSDCLLYLCARAISAISLGRVKLRKYYFVSQPVPNQPLLPPNRGLTIVVERIDRNHSLVANFPRPAQVIARRFQSGALCFLATKGERFIGFLWLQTGAYMEDEVRSRFIPVPANQAVWDFDVHVEPEHRSSLAFARLWDTANQFLRDRAVEWTVSRISAFNPGSINAHVRLGAFPIASACFLSGQRWQILLSGARPYIHFSFGETSVPEIRLSAKPGNTKHYRRFAARPANL